MDALARGEGTRNDATATETVVAVAVTHIGGVDKTERKGRLREGNSNPHTQVDTNSDGTNNGASAGRVDDHEHHVYEKDDCSLYAAAGPVHVTGLHPDVEHKRADRDSAHGDSGEGDLVFGHRQLDMSTCSAEKVHTDTSSVCMRGRGLDDHTRDHAVSRDVLGGMHSPSEGCAESLSLSHNPDPGHTSPDPGPGVHDGSPEEARPDHEGRVSGNDYDSDNDQKTGKVTEFGGRDAMLDQNGQIKAVPGVRGAATAYPTPTESHDASHTAGNGNETGSVNSGVSQGGVLNLVGGGRVSAFVAGKRLVKAHEDDDDEDDIDVEDYKHAVLLRNLSPVMEEERGAGLFLSVCLCACVCMYVCIRVCVHA